MAKFIRGNTKRKGCDVCGRDLFKMHGEQALVLEGSKGRVAVCSPACADKYDPDFDVDAAAKADAATEAEPGE